MGRKMQTILATLLAGFVTSTTLLAEAPENELQVTTAKKATIPRIRLLDGSVEAVNQSTVSAQTGGQILEVFYDVDDFVMKGNELVRLKDSDQKAQLAQATAELDSAVAQLNETKIKFERAVKVYEQEVISKAEMDQITAALKSAEAGKEAAEAAVERAKEQLEHTRVRAPYTGIVTERHAELGEIASPGTPLMSGISLEKLRVNVHVPQTIIGAIRDNGQVQVISPADGTPIEVEEITIFPYADQRSNTFKVRVELPKDTARLFPGMFVKVAFTIDSRKAVVVPARAVVKRSELTGVYVIDKENRPSLRMIRTGAIQPDGTIVVLSGLEDGESIALNPVAAGILIKQTKREEPGHE